MTVDQFDIYLYAVDAAMKYRGFSLSGEYYFRWLQGLKGIGGPLPITTLYDHGFYAQAGYFLVPKRVELMAKTSQIFGEFGSASEYAGGLNWFVNGSHNWKFTFDATRVIGSPAQNSGPNYRAGDTGTMFRAQFQAAF